VQLHSPHIFTHNFTINHLETVKPLEQYRVSKSLLHSDGNSFKEVGSYRRCLSRGPNRVDISHSSPDEGIGPSHGKLLLSLFLRIPDDGQSPETQRPRDPVVLPIFNECQTTLASSDAGDANSWLALIDLLDRVIFMSDTCTRTFWGLRSDRRVRLTFPTATIS
jgi:hypothetical protein